MEGNNTVTIKGNIIELRSSNNVLLFEFNYNTLKIEYPTLNASNLELYSDNAINRQHIKDIFLYLINERNQIYVPMITKILGIATKKYNIGNLRLDAQDDYDYLLKYFDDIPFEFDVYKILRDKFFTEYISTTREEWKKIVPKDFKLTDFFKDVIPIGAVTHILEPPNWIDIFRIILNQLNSITITKTQRTLLDINKSVEYNIFQFIIRTLQKSFEQHNEFQSPKEIKEIVLARLNR